MISQWSHSRLEMYETCPRRVYLQYVDKIPTPELVPPPGKEEHPLTRGSRVHDAAERFIKEDVLLIEELAAFKRQFEEAREQYRTKPDTCIVENDWAITDTWTPTGWNCKDTWGRMKLDLGLINDKHMRIIDYKTGKKYALKHKQQGQLYGICAALRFPEIESFTVEFWYLDQDDVMETEYSRFQLLMFQDDFDRRARSMISDTEFAARPSAYACKFCPYGEGRDGNKYCEFRYSFTN